MRGSRFLFLVFPLLISLFSCSVQKQIARSARSTVLEAPLLQTAHIGISLFDPATGKYLYNFQGDKYFVPASNTKIATCYAAMKYLTDSLIAFRYVATDTAIFLIPSGDPTLLHSGFKNQPATRFLQNTKKNIYIKEGNWKEEALGSGWSWSDYNEAYMAERSPLPVYGNIIRWIQSTTKDEDGSETKDVFSEPAVNWPMTFSLDNSDSSFLVTRNLGENLYTTREGKETYKQQDIPFITHGLQSAAELLVDTIGKAVSIVSTIPKLGKGFSILHSQPTDSLLKPMMHRSDNFFAEQSLLMASNEKLGLMSDEAIIDTLLKTDFSDLPQRPRWVDGSGLSRYNLFTPQDFVSILHKMKTTFGMERIKNIFPTGGEGTLSNYYVDEKGFIYAKTGSLSGVICISGYLTTRKGKELLFSVLVNNHRASGTDVRRAVERFLQELRRNQ